jgi:phosphoribosylaminoimidazolecarboxamide formyltransferase/IMP cyclohydrolase
VAKIRRALISVSDKAGVVELARGLAALGVEIISTGGTMRVLAAADVPVTTVESVTGYPEMMEGRVKTLHPAIHGSLLADRSKPEHMEALGQHGFSPIDLLVVNLYPFEATAAREGATRAEVIESIDIGGPAMIRSAAKNADSVAVVVSPADYSAILEELRLDGGGISASTRRRLARAAFAHTAAYDAAIASYLQAGEDPTETVLPETLPLAFRKKQDLRYGENPHQRAAFYVRATAEPSVATAKQLNGRELSFINILDANAALELVKEFERPAAAIIKHTNPCGCAVAETPVEAYRLARDGELAPFNPPGSRFGGIIALNRPVDVATAEEIVLPGSYYEVIIAPEFAPEAVRIFAERRGWGENVRVLAVGPLSPTHTLNEVAPGLPRLDFRSVVGGLLVQERDMRPLDRTALQVVTASAPTESEYDDLLFAWSVVKHVKSNAIVLARGGQLVGVGAGQMNRALPVQLAIQMAGPRAEGSVLASDALFPIPDGPEHAGKAGVRAIIQPGGARRDEEVIAVANRYGMAMVFTGVRCFRH